MAALGPPTWQENVWATTVWAAGVWETAGSQPGGPAELIPDLVKRRPVHRKPEWKGR